LTDNSYSFMQLACRIAFSKVGLTSPNPAVGAVIVKNGEAAGTGGTGPFGSDHAEVRAIKDAKSKGADLSGAEMYVSLEPCSHFGKTPPCTEAIIESGISTVYIAVKDPNPLVAGKGIARLAECGIDVIMSDQFSNMGYDLIRGFKKLILQKKPFVVSKSAITLDGRIATSAGDSKWISNQYSRYISHKLRAKSDAIIIGKNTYEADNPSLDVRITDFSESAADYFSGENFTFSGYDNFYLRELLTAEITGYHDPLRVMAGIPEIFHESSKFFKDDNYVIAAGSEEYKAALKRRGAESLKKLNLEIAPPLSDGEMAEYILDMLYRRGVLSVMLEGGAGLNSAFFKSGAIDQFMYFIAPKVAGNGIAPLNNAGSAMMAEALNLYNVSTVLIDNDLLYNAYREEYKCIEM
jgi:diaminohydroxyphosphoribosylaminopyrimidine deaminase/5-amino-6-(5-phosphoribosylamino)uracil reductase